MTVTRFHEWYSSYGSLFQNISSNVCNQTLQDYLTVSNGDTCDLHIDCILENTRESVKSAIGAAAIFLSLVPTIMSMLGPSLVQLAILSTRRPVLSFLLSVGSSEFYLDGLFRIESTEELLSIAKGERLFPRIRGPRAALISAGEYVLAGLAVANVVHNSYRLGSKTIVSFVCNTWFFPLVWTLMLPGIFLMVTIPFQFSGVAEAIRRRSYYHRQEEPPRAARRSAALSLEPYPALNHQGVPRADSFKLARNIVALEGLPSLGHPSIPSQSLPNFEKWLTILLNAASFVAAIHVLVGICFFSSILFISVVDAIEVTLRYLASAAVCRLVVTLEFTGMKAGADHDQGDEVDSIIRQD